MRTAAPIILALALVLVCCSGPEPTAPQDATDDLIVRALDGAEAADQARALLGRNIDRAPSSPEALAARLRLLDLELGLGHYEAARDVLLDAVRAHPGDEAVPRLLFRLAMLLQGPLDRPDEARECLSRVSGLYPDHPLAAEARRLLELMPAHGPGEGDPS
jgi:TolA-binding protein